MMTRYVSQRSFLILFFFCLSFITQSFVKGGEIEAIRKIIDSPLIDIQWADLSTVYVLSEKGSVYLSNDGGRAWQGVSKKMGGSIISKVSISPVQPGNVFFSSKNQNSQNENWRTLDGGKTFQSVEPLDILDVRLNPTKPNHLLVSARSPGCQGQGSNNQEDQTYDENPDKEQERRNNKRTSNIGLGSTACFKVLYGSNDFGSSWIHLTDYVVQFDWSPIVGQMDSEGNHGAHETIYATVHNTHRGNQKFGVWNSDIDFISSDDWFHTRNVLVKHGNRFIFGVQPHAFLFVAAVNPHDQTQVTLQVSRDNSTRINFHPATLPVELTEHSYTVLDTSEGSVFLHVNHAPVAEEAYAGHVYISDYSGLSYSLSLPYNHRSPEGKCDFEKIRGLDGIYVANFVDEIQMDSEEKEEDRNVNSLGSGAAARVQDRKNRKRVKTVISFDKGGDWDYLEPPKLDVDNNPIQCSGECHLHLYGAAGGFGPFYSSESALGILMATGSIGSHLSYSVDEVNTYMSRDAGATWIHIGRGSHIYEYGDFGSLILMAKDRTASQSIFYSWDEGLTWTSLKISDTPFEIENIITEPDSTSQQFIVYGRSQSDGSGIIIFLNFDDLHQATCKGHDEPDSSQSDYETWTPSDGITSRNNKCLLGRTTTYVRRRRDTPCFNPDSFERPISIENCACELHDFECDYGYEKQAQASKGTTRKGKGKKSKSSNTAMGGLCVAMSTPPLHADIFGKAESCEFNTFYRVTKGYRKVPGDTCIGGAESEFEASIINCPGWISGSIVGKIMFILLILVVLSLILVALASKYDLIDTILNYWDIARTSVSRLANGQLSSYSHSYGILGQAPGPSSLADDDTFYLSEEEPNNHDNKNTNKSEPDKDKDKARPESIALPITFSALPLPQRLASSNQKVPVLPLPQ